MDRFQDQPQDVCCRGKIHIRTGALIVILLTVAGSVYELFECTQPEPDWGWYGLDTTSSAVMYGISGVLGLLVSGCGIYAARQRVAWAWLPITAYSAVETVDLAVFGILDIVWHTFDKDESDSFGIHAVFAVVFALFVVLSIFLAGWSATITYGVYMWQKRQEAKERDDCFGSSVALRTVQATSGSEEN